MNEEHDCEDVDQESEKVSTSYLLSDIEFDIERLKFDNAEREIVDEMLIQGLVLIYASACSRLLKHLSQTQRVLVIFKSHFICEKISRKV